MRILICDDNPIIVEQLKEYICKYFNKRGLKTPDIACFYDGTSLLSDTGNKDIIFIDIEMPGTNGIEVGNRIKSVNVNSIIFVVTSYDEYLDDAMRFQVFRYLSKPIDCNRLYRNLDDAVYLYNHFSVNIPIETKDGVHTVSASDIIAVEALSRKVIVHTVANDYESVNTMAYWISMLPRNCFFQSHRSFIINFEHVEDFDHSLIHLDNMLNAYLTRRKYSAFKDAYLLYLESNR